ncbi:hypothetical protein FOZ61_002266 [Perkinsus olseni]|uniref:Uncharacterized protein n=1 Tax=Perkinsus olseni TaxID=32597 RepID=A0A7J6MB13_PEROL|nr:hypothetical protein FOZ61_002266 [Perkinsus olseni]KAF4668380.1 hypothetical protein FOL46_002025 [Perkinsus olseni]
MLEIPVKPSAASPSPGNLATPSARHLSSHFNTVVVQTVLEKDVAVVGEVVQMRIRMKLEPTVKEAIRVQVVVTPPAEWGAFLSGWSGSRAVTLLPGVEKELAGLALVGVKPGPVAMQHLVRASLVSQSSGKDLPVSEVDGGVAIDNFDATDLFVLPSTRGVPIERETV